MMRKRSTTPRRPRGGFWLAIFLILPAAAMAQDIMHDLDLASPSFTERELSREQVMSPDAERRGKSTR